jgi:hypothetical protein
MGALLALRGPDISLAPEALPYYALLSVGRMTAAYALSLLVALCYGRAAAEHRQAEQVLMPLLDVLQSVPILSFLPVVLLSLNAVFPQRVAAELAAIVLIFTSQAWNRRRQVSVTAGIDPGDAWQCRHHQPSGMASSLPCGRRALSSGVSYESGNCSP